MKRFIILIINVITLNFLFLAHNSYGYGLVEIESPHNPKMITIGTGSIHGLYFPVGASICRLLNNIKYPKTPDSTSINYRCEAEPSAGSFMNLANLVEGKINFGLIQSEIQYKAYHKLLQDSNQDYSALRAVFSLQTETYTMLVSKNSEIKSFNDIKGKKINIGPVNSAIRSALEGLIEAQKWDIKKDFAGVLELGANEQTEALCKDDVDAILFVVGHPNNAVKEATSDCEAKLIPIDLPSTQSLVKRKLFMNNAVIPGGMYFGNDQDIKTLGVRATLVTTNNTADEMVNLLVRIVMENLDKFKTMNPALQGLNKKDMVGEGNIVPFHKAAQQYYKEQGLLN